MSNSGADQSTGDSTTVGWDASEHLTDVEDGCGCVEIWERLSEHRTAD